MFFLRYLFVEIMEVEVRLRITGPCRATRPSNNGGRRLVSYIYALYLAPGAAN